MSQNVKDVSMVDINEAMNDSQANDSDQNGSSVNPSNLTQSLSKMNIDDSNELTPQLSSRKSTLIFNDDFDETPSQHKHIEHQNNYDARRNVADNEDEDEDAVNNIITDRSDGSASSLSPESSTMSSGEQGRTQNVEYANTSQEGFNKGFSENQYEGSAHQSPSIKEQQPQPTPDRRPAMVPVEITWQQGGSKVYVTGSFTGWRKMIGLVPVANKPGVFHIKLQLPAGTHRFRFIVDNELRFSDFLPTATDQMGNFVNYLEIVSPESMQMMDYESNAQQQNQQKQNASNLQSSDNSVQQPQQQHHTTAPPQVRRQPSQSKDGKLSARSQLALHIEEDPDDMGNGYTRFKGEQQSKTDYEYTQDIPAVFTDPSVMEQYYLTLDQQQNNQQNMSWLTPPQLPPQLENVILNNYNKNAEPGSENNSGALPIPNHVVLNHLATSSIKHNTLCVASIVRYKRKYATQILYAPLQ